jgi:hypothetical protein
MENEQRKVIWTDYFLYRASIRDLDLAEIEKIVRYSPEHYVDSDTLSNVVVGLHKNDLLLVAYEITEIGYEVVTAHTTTRQQITFRLESGRYTHE